VFVNSCDASRIRFLVVVLTRVQSSRREGASESRETNTILWERRGVYNMLLYQCKTIPVYSRVLGKRRWIDTLSA